MIDSPLLSIFGFIGSLYGLIIPLLIILSLTLIYIASLQSPGAKSKSIGEAIYCYILHAVSVLLMTLGALPTVYSVFAGISYTPRTYFALLVVFAVGGLLFLLQDQSARSLDTASKAVIEYIYLLALKIIGNMLTLFSALSILLNIILDEFGKGWWAMPFVLLLYGMLLSWATRSDRDLKVFQTAPMTVAPQASKASKPSSSKKKKK